MRKRRPRASARRQRPSANIRGHELYRSLVEASMDAITMTDLKGRITYASPSTLELHGFERPEELLGRSALDMIAPEEHERAAGNMRRTLAEGRSGNVEYTLLRKDGGRFVGELSAAVVKDAGGKPIGFIATVRDITERKRVEDTLRQNEAMIQLIASQIPVSIWTVDMELRLTSTLGVSVPGSGLGEAQGSGLTLMDVFGTMDHPMIKGYRGALQGEPATTEFEARGRAYRATLEPLRDHDGNVIGAIGVTIDVTDLKRLTDALVQREETCRSLIENLPIGVYRTTEAGEFLHANQTMAEILGFENAAELMRANAYDLYARESDRIDLMQKLRNAKSLTVEAEARRRDGRVVRIRDYIRAVLDESGRIAYLEGALVEIPAKTEVSTQTRPT